MMNIGGPDDLWKIPIFGGFFDNPNEERHQQQFGRAADAYAKYRPVAHDARINAINQLMSMYGPANQMLSQMGLPTFSLNAQSPFPGGAPPAPPPPQGPPPGISRGFGGRRGT